MRTPQKKEEEKTISKMAHATDCQLRQMINPEEFEVTGSDA